jgi:hypothetical protein
LITFRWFYEAKGEYSHGKNNHQSKQKYQTVKNGKQYKKSVAVHHTYLIKPPKCYLRNIKAFSKISRRGIFKEAGDLGRGCIFRRPPSILL